MTFYAGYADCINEVYAIVNALPTFNGKTSIGIIPFKPSQLPAAMLIPTQGPQARYKLGTGIQTRINLDIWVAIAEPEPDKDVLAHVAQPMGLIVDALELSPTLGGHAVAWEPREYSLGPFAIAAKLYTGGLIGIVIIFRT